MKKIALLIIILAPIISFAQKPNKKAEKKAERVARVKELQKRAAEGEIVFSRQTAFGIKLNTDGYGGFVELGRMKTLRRANLYWLEIGEKKHPKEEKLAKAGFLGFSGNPFVYGKQNNMYFAKLGFGQQVTLGSKGLKNGVAVSAIYGGGFSAGLLKPYYLEIKDPANSQVKDIRYTDTTATLFLDPSVVQGSSGIGKGWGELKFVPGAHVRTALRFDYGRYNEMVSALEVGLTADFYSKTMPIMVETLPSDPNTLVKARRFFFNAYVALTFGRRK